MQELAESSPGVAGGCIEQHPGGRRLLGETPGGLVHQEITDEGRVVASLFKLTGEFGAHLVEIWVEHIRKIAVNQRHLLIIGAQRAGIRNACLAGNLPLRPVGDGVETQAAQLPEGDLRPFRVPVFPESADQVSWPDN